MREQQALLEILLPHGPSKFPTPGQGIEILRGRLLTQTPTWKKAIVWVRVTYRGQTQQQLRLIGWARNKQGQWKVRQKFNISPARYAMDLIDVLQGLLHAAGKETQRGRLMTQLLQRMDLLARALQEATAERQREYVQIQSDRIVKLEKAVRELEDMIEEGKSERSIHAFLKKPEHAWMFGPDYRGVRHEQWITIASRNDVLLERHDGFVDIAELKGPSNPLFEKSGTRKVWSKHVKDAVSQMMDYLAQAREHYSSIAKLSGLNVFFPKGYVIIGRRRDEERELLRVHNEFLNRVEILTYDDLLDRARQTLDFYKSYA
jgi:hypothetical protein